MGTTPTWSVSIADALMTGTQQRVLGILFGHPERSFFASEIFARAGSGRGTVQRELERLQASGLVTVRSVGNQKHFQANASSPIFEELRSIILKTSGLADPIADALRPFEQIDLAFIYGSVAARAETASSDVDLMIVSDDVLLEDLLRRLAAAERETGRAIHPTLYTPAEFNSRRKNSAFVRKVLAGPVIPIIGSVDAASATR